MSLKESVHDFSVHCIAIDKSDILNIDKQLMFKNRVK